VINRKPRVGDVVVDGDGKRWQVIGHLSDDITRIRPLFASYAAESLFIWRFHDGPNKWFSFDKVSDAVDAIVSKSGGES
jgi:hypothetical protein